MSVVRIVLIISAVVTFQACTAAEECVEIKRKSGTISNSFTVYNYHESYKCWKISNPEKRVLTLKSVNFENYKEPCYSSLLSISLVEENRNITLCLDNFRKENITTSSDVVIRHSVFYIYHHKNTTSNFTLTFNMEQISGLEEAQLRAISWLYSRRTPLWDWRENTLKAVTVLFLSGATDSSHTNLAQELMVKQAEFRVAISLQRGNVSATELSSFIHFLLATCGNPRRFAHYDLIERLRSQIESTGGFIHPVAYLALCNAHEPWPKRAIGDLTSILSSESEYPFIKDIQAYAVMALACEMNQKNETGASKNASILSLYKNKTQEFKDKLSKGIAGNVYDTAVLAQAVMASGEEYSDTWNATKMLYYLIKELNSSSVDFQAVYLTLPLLSEKSFADIAYTDCSGSQRRNISDLSEVSGAKIQVPTGYVRYSLFVGDEKEIIHTLSLKLPPEYTAYQMMQLAAIQNPRFTFKWQRESGKMYVYDIAQTPNDPETGKSWLLFLGSNRKRSPTHFTKGPDELVLQDGDHLIYWYKTAKI